MGIHPTVRGHILAESVHVDQLRTADVGDSEHVTVL